MSYNNAQILDIFGKLLMENVRDDSLDAAEKILNAELNGIRHKRIGAALSDLTDKEKQNVLELCAVITTNTIFEFLELIEWKNDIIKLLFFNENNTYNLNEISTGGLGGEMFTDSGWISKFSKYKFDEDCLF